MRIFYYAQVDLSGESGSIGSVRHVVEVVNRLSGLDHELVVFVPESNGEASDKLSAKVVTFPDKPGFLGFLITIISCLYRMIRECLRNPPDVIYSREMLYTVHTTLLGVVLGIPTVMEINGFQPEELRTDPEFNPLFYPFLIVAEGINYWLSDRLLFVSSTTEEKARRFYSLSSCRTTIIQNGVNTERCRPMDTQKCRSTLGFEGGGLWCGFLGYLFPWSGVDYMIRAAPAVLEQCPDAKFMVIGSGTWGDYLPRMAEEYGVEDHFIFTGEVPWDEVPVHLNCLDLGLSPYTTERDTLSSLKTYEYMACGLPVIAADVGELKSILNRSGAGTVFEPENEQALASKIIKFFKDDSLRQEYGNNAREFAVERLDWQYTAEETETLLSELA